MHFTADVHPNHILNLVSFISNPKCPSNQPIFSFRQDKYFLVIQLLIHKMYLVKPYSRPVWSVTQRL